MAEESQGETVREFRDPKELYSFLHSTGLHSLSYELYDFYTKYKNIGVGCGCQKKNREDVAKKAYVNSLCMLSEEHKSTILEALGSDSAKFYLDGGIFAEFK